MKRKLVVVKDNAVLTEIGGVSGPIVTPTRIAVDAIKAMICSRRTVLECDPRDPKNENKQVKLTLTNYAADNFTGKQETAAAQPKTVAPAEPKKEEKPVVEEPKKEEVKAPVEEKVENDAEPQVTEEVVEEKKEEAAEKPVQASNKSKKNKK